MSNSAANTKSERGFLPAAGREWLLPIYDPFVKLLGGEAVRMQLLQQAQLQPGYSVLDVGCGTGSLVLLAKRLSPEVRTTALDPDSGALARARRKASQAKIAAQFDQGFGDQLPYPAASFDRVFSSLMYHHIAAEQKDAVLREIVRVLKPGGEFHLCDFNSDGSGARGFLLRISHPKDGFKDNPEGRVLGLMKQAGFADCCKTGSRSMFVGTVAYYRARR